MDKDHGIKKAVVYFMEKHLTCKTLHVVIKRQPPGPSFETNTEWLKLQFIDWPLEAGSKRESVP